MPVYQAEQYHIDMVKAIIPEREEMLSVKEIGGILAEPLRECGATLAYLFEPPTAEVVLDYLPLLPGGGAPRAPDVCPEDAPRRTQQKRER